MWRGLGSRAKARPDQIIDVGYNDLISDPAAVLDRILDAVNLGPDKAWLSALPIGRKERQEKIRDRHHYNLSQFGLDANQIRERFASYIETYGLADPIRKNVKNETERTAKPDPTVY